MLFRRYAGLIENAGQDLSMIQTNREVIESQRHQRITGCRNQLSFDDHRFRPKDIDIALIKLAKAPTRGTIGAPDGLNLIALEKLWQLVLILGDDAGERNCQIVTQS